MACATERTARRNKCTDKRRTARAIASIGKSARECQIVSFLSLTFGSRQTQSRTGITMVLKDLVAVPYGYGHARSSRLAARMRPPCEQEAGYISEKPRHA